MKVLVKTNSREACGMKERHHEPLNLTKKPRVGRQYYYWDRIVGRADEGLCEVLLKDGDTVRILDLKNNCVFDIKIDSVDWELNPYDEVYSSGLDWLNTL